MNLLFSNIVLIFVVSDQSVGSEMARNSRAFFNCPLHTTVVCFRPFGETLRKDLTAETATAFIWPNVKKLRSMKNDSIGIFTPQQIIEDLVTTDEASRMRDHLREMLDAYLLSEDDSRCRHEVYGTYLAIDGMMRRMELMDKRKAA